MLSPTNPLRNPGYRLLALFASIGAMGGGFHFIASYWILYERTESTQSVAQLIIAYFLPAAAMMPVAGFLVDRFDRRMVLLWVNLYSAALTLGLAALLASGRFETGHLYPYAVLSTIGNSISWTAFVAWMKDSLSPEELIHANSLNTALFQGGYLAGAGLAGVVYPWIGGVAAFVIDAAATGLWCVYWIRVPRWYPDRERAVPAASRGFVREFGAGLRVVAADLPLFLFASLAIAPRLAAQLVNVLHVGFSRDVLGTGSAGFGLLDMGYGVGAMFCGLGFPWLLERTRRRSILPGASLLVAAAACLAMSAVGGLAGGVLCLAVLGASVHVVAILANSTLQREVGREVIGRVSSIVHLGQYLLVPPLVWALGWYARSAPVRIVHDHPIRDAFVLCAVLFAVFAVASRGVTALFERSRAGRQPAASPVPAEA